MSKIQLDLCKSILQEQFGPIVQAVASKLISKGRQSLPLLFKNCNEGTSKNEYQEKYKLAPLTMKGIKEALCVLIQQNLVTYAAAAQKGGRSIIYYELSIEMVFIRERFPRYLKMSHDIAGLVSSRVLESILLYGRLGAKSLVSVLADDFNQETVLAGLHGLIDHKLIVPVTVEDQNTLADRHLLEESAEIAKSGTGVPLTAYEKKKLRAKMSHERNVAIADGPQFGSNSLKRRMDQFDDQEDSLGLFKKSRDDYDYLLDSNDCFKVNPMQFHLHARNTLIVEYTRKKVNFAAAELVRIFLELASPRFKVLKEDKSESISLNRLAMEVGKQNVQLPIEGSSKSDVLEYTDLLASSHISILSPFDTKTSGLYQLQLKAITFQIKLGILDTIVQEKCGSVACRIFRILRAKQKLDDKNVSKIALVDEKLCRHNLYLMLKLGLVFMQDVPKTIDHSASRTIFLWFVDPVRTMELLVQDIYKMLYRLKAREQFEISKKKLLLQKAARSDIQNGTATLSKGELAKLKELDNFIAQFNVQTARVDETLMIMREF